tara:strand:+ start:203 stop:490 length:288 start_codon:yes stop_codon:yes gene_type:complete
MLKSEIISKLNKKFNSLSPNDTEKIINLFFNKISNSLTDNKNVEIRGFGSFKKKINKAKMVRNPKTNEKKFKNETNKIHFKISKILHGKINNINS